MNFNANNFSLPLAGKTYIMAIMNLTPDSFYANSRVETGDAAQRALELVEAGADMLDLGAQSTAPSSLPITAAHELDRLLPSLEAIRQAVDVPLSVDTFFTEVACAALESGADIINDVSGLAADEMAALVKAHNAGWIVMHTGGKSSSERAAYPNGVINGINSFFMSAYNTAQKNGVAPEQLCFDPGIGFGKTREDDLNIIKNFSLLNCGSCALLAGLSRKRVTRLCGDELSGTVAANTACVMGGANIIRVHDVPQAAAAARMADLIRGDTLYG